MYKVVIDQVRHGSSNHQKVVCCHDLIIRIFGNFLKPIYEENMGEIRSATPWIALLLIIQQESLCYICLLLSSKISMKNILPMQKFLEWRVLWIRVKWLQNKLSWHAMQCRCLSKPQRMGKDRQGEISRPLQV